MYIHIYIYIYTHTYTHDKQWLPNIIIYGSWCGLAARVARSRWESRRPRPIWSQHTVLWYTILGYTTSYYIIRCYAMCLLYCTIIYIYIYTHMGHVHVYRHIATTVLLYIYWMHASTADIYTYTPIV